MNKTKMKMVYLLASRNEGKASINGTGGFTPESFKTKTIVNLKSATREYLDQVQTPKGQGMSNKEFINSLSPESRASYLDTLFTILPVCLAIPKAEFDQILNEGLIYPKKISMITLYDYVQTREANIDLRNEFIEKYRIYDIGRSMADLLAFYETGILHRLDKQN